MIKTILFDLDGTLLPMDQEVFTKSYFAELAKKLAPYEYEMERLIPAIWNGVKAMVINTSGGTNEEVFWKDFAKSFPEKDVRKQEPIFLEFYQKEFQKAQQVCGFNPEAAKTVQLCKELGYEVALATNPLFPSVATESRIRWAGLAPEDFLLYTTYENSHACKPNLDYYREILQKIDRAPEECVMVGNDVGEDMIAEKLGMKVFLLKDCLINMKEQDINRYPQGGFRELQEYLKGL